MRKEVAALHRDSHSGTSYQGHSYAHTDPYPQGNLNRSYQDEERPRWPTKAARKGHYCSMREDPQWDLSQRANSETDDREEGKFFSDEEEEEEEMEIPEPSMRFFKL
ncbi:UNVERIFIED_CONTAM: hypothetical protein K2H54_038087 [Gekko kuhli]